MVRTAWVHPWRMDDNRYIYFFGFLLRLNSDPCFVSLSLYFFYVFNFPDTNITQVHHIMIFTEYHIHLPCPSFTDYKYIPSEFQCHSSYPYGSFAVLLRCPDFFRTVIAIKVRCP